MIAFIRIMRLPPWKLGLILFLLVTGPRLHADINLTSYYPIMMAGSAQVSPADSPALRVDPNTTHSPFAGVGSFKLVNNTGTYLCSGVAISPRHILTAAHALDVNNNGNIDFTPNQATFYLNYGSGLSHSLAVSEMSICPGFTGFSFTSLTHDDIAIVTLANDLPAGVPIYDIYSGQLPYGSTFTMVGYGHSGYGDLGWEYAYRAKYDVKRTGQNSYDVSILDDDGYPIPEVYLFDFDDPSVTDPNDPRNRWGGVSLGNQLESQLGFGDSGGPSFVWVDGEWKLWGINTFLAQFQGGPEPPLFGSAGGGMIVSAYLPWLRGYLSPSPSAVGLGYLGLYLICGLKRRWR